MIARALAGQRLRPGWPAALRQRLGPPVARLASGPWLPVLVTAVLGLWRAGDKSIWLDEGVSIMLARLPTIDLVNYVARAELHASPYYLALHPWLALGQSEAAIRGLSVVFAIVGVGATWAIGRRYGVGFEAALLLSVSPLFIEQAQNARVYTLVVAGSAVSTLLLLRLIEQPRLGRALAYAAAAALMAYLQPLASLVVAGHGLVVLVFVPRPIKWRLLAVFVPVAIAWLPMLRFMLRNRDRIAWIPETTPDLLFNEMVIFAGGLFAAALLLVMLVLGMRRDPLAPWLLVPLVGTILVSLLIQPVLLARYLIAALPAATVIAARNRSVLVVALAVASLVGVSNWYEHGVKEDWRGLAAWVSAEAEPSDAVVFAPGYLRAPFAYYAEVGQPIYPGDAWGKPEYHGPADMAGLAAAPRVWLIGSGEGLPAELADALRSYSVVLERTFSHDRVRAALLLPAAGR